MDVCKNDEGGPILQGWLLKEKRSLSAVTAKMIKRWFVIEKTVDSDGELVSTLSYYKSPRAKYDDRCGWIFLSDVICLEEVKEKSGSNTARNITNRRKSIAGDYNWDEWIIAVKHPARVFRLRAQDRYQHRLWFHTLNEACQHLQSETQHKKDDVDVDRAMDKLKPAGAFHKDAIDPRKSFKSDKRDISVELEFMRSLNRSSAEESKHQKSPYDVVSPTSQSSLHARNESIVNIEKDGDFDGGKLVYDEELIRLGYIRDPLQGSKSCIDDDASIESCNQTIDVIQTNVSKTHKQESHTKLDHRLEGNKGFHCGDETIQKRLQRAIQSDGVQVFNLGRESDCNTYDGMVSMKEGSLLSHYDDEVVTMVKEFSMEDISDDESFSKSSVEQSIISNDEDSIIEQSKTHTQRSFKSSSMVEPSKLDYKADNTSKILSPTDANSSVPQNNRRYSFESDCSFLPDHDFATSNWDSE